MPSLNVLIQNGEVCCCLRAKTMFYQPIGATLAAPDSDDESYALPQGPFWCAHTQSLLGPDGHIADAESCRPGRACCETT